MFELVSLISTVTKVPLGYMTQIIESQPPKMEASSGLPNVAGQQTTTLKTLVITQPINPISILEELRSKHFAKVHYYPLTMFRPVRDDEELPTEEVYREADVIWGFFVPPNLKSIEQTPKLKLFQALSAGYNQLDSSDYFKTFDDPKKYNIPCASSSGIHVTTIGEHVLGTVLALYHKFHLLIIKASLDERWVNAHNELGAGGNYIRELSDLTVGIIGYGHIGRETARLFRCCGSRILALTRDGKQKKNSGYIIKGTGDDDGGFPAKYYQSGVKEERKMFLSECDVVVDTLPSSAATTGFMGETEFRWMKDDGVFVNIGRGDTVDQDALVKALQAGAPGPFTDQPKPESTAELSPKSEDTVAEKEHSDGNLKIGGASLDVTSPEPLPLHHPLFQLQNVIVTPHCSAFSKNYFNKALDLLLQNCERVKQGKGCLNTFRGKGEFDD